MFFNGEFNDLRIVVGVVGGSLQDVLPGAISRLNNFALPASLLSFDGNKAAISLTLHNAGSASRGVALLPELPGLALLWPVISENTKLEAWGGA